MDASVWRVSEAVTEIYCLVVLSGAGKVEFSLKGIEEAGKTRFQIADELEEIARRLRD